MQATTSNSLARVKTCCRVMSAMVSLTIRSFFHCPLPWVGISLRVSLTSLQMSSFCLGVIMSKPGSTILAFSSIDRPGF
jgi:hypothetical protein